MSLGQQQQVALPTASEPDKYDYDLGQHRRAITTSHPGAQIWFDRGINWMYGFCHEEAVRCFEHALELDEHCAMALWGLACTSGPHYNFGWEANSPAMRGMMAQKTHEFAVRAKQASEASKATAKPTTALEDALIDAIQPRFPQASEAAQVEDYAAWNAAYADKMQQVYETAPADDMDVTALYAEAMLNLAPWKMWDLKTGQPTGAPARTLQAKAVLERALGTAAGLRHPGVLHMYIHLMEMSAQPEAAVAASQALRGLVPDSGHLQHMASHIDVLVGTYREGMQSNIDSVEADRKYLGAAGLSGLYTLYAMHNIGSLVFAAMMAGNAHHSRAACDRLEEIITEPFLRTPDPPWADYAEAMASTRYHALIRFGRWADILALPLPHDQDLYCVTTAFAHYAKAIAHAALGDLPAADAERAKFAPASARVPDSRKNFPNSSRDALDLAAAMLEGELEYRRGNFDAAFEHLTDAVRRDDALLYAEPPTWMVPARHPIAALLLEQGHVDRAAEYYAQDLGLDYTPEHPDKAALARPRHHPSNPWALKGYHDCLVRLGREDEARDVKKMLEKAATGADVDISASCFCALKSVANGGATNGSAKACCL